jgi:hypothetical protein
MRGRVIKLHAVVGKAQVVGVESQRSTPIVGLVQASFAVVANAQLRHLLTQIR